MTGRFRNASIVMISIAVVSTASLAARPLEISKARKLAIRIEKDKNLVTESEKRQRKILSSLFEINQKIKKISREKSHLESEKSRLEVSIAELNEEIKDLQADLQKSGRNLINHVRWIHQSRGFSWLNLFSETKGPVETDLNMYIFAKLSDREKRNIREYFIEKKKLQRHQEKLEGRLARLNQITNDLQTKEKDFLERQSERKIALSEIKTTKSKILERLKNYRGAGLYQKLEDTGLLDGITRASFFEEKGQIQFPLDGELKQRFGIVKADQSSYYKNNKGIFIRSRSAQDVRSVFEGKVSFVGSIGGFGPTAIIDHGDHYYTVYSSLASVSVHEGQLIRRNQSLGQSGASDFYNDNGVYFEIRHFSEPQDPMEWLKKGFL